MSHRPPLPADEEAECLLLGTLLAEGRDGPLGSQFIWNELRSLEGRPGDELFNLVHLRPLWEIIRYRAKEGLEFNFTAINSDANGKAAIEAAGGLSAVLSMGPAAPGQILELVDRVTSLSHARTTCKVLLDAIEWLEVDPAKAAYIAANASRALEGIVCPRGGFPAPEKLSDFLAKPISPRQEIIVGLLRRGDKMTLGGSSKSKKTWIATHLALCVSAGIPWMGVHTVKSPVTFLNLELPPDVFHARLVKLCAELNFPMEDADFRVWNLRGERASIERIDQAMRADKAPIGLLVLDPLYKLLGDRVENDAGDMADLMGHLEAIASRHNCAMVVPAHFSKGNQSEKSSMDRIGGSGVFARDADAIVTMTDHEESDCFTVEAVLRSFAPAEPFVIRWNYPLFHRDDQLDPAKLKAKLGRPCGTPPTDVLNILPSSGMTYSQWRDESMRCLNISEGTFKKKRSQLVDARKVILSEKNQHYIRTQSCN